MHGCRYALSVLKPDGNSVIVFFRYNKNLGKKGKGGQVANKSAAQNDVG